MIPQMRRNRTFKLSSRRASHSQIRAKKLTRVKSQLVSHKLTKGARIVEIQRRKERETRRIKKTRSKMIEGIYAKS
jgi:hypothetical protein